MNTLIKVGLSILCLMVFSMTALSVFESKALSLEKNSFRIHQQIQDKKTLDINQFGNVRRVPFGAVK